MSMVKRYTCNICNEVVQVPTKCFGIHFTNNHDFTLGGYGCTDGKHICFMCAKQLKAHLNNDQISEELER